MTVTEKVLEFQRKPRWCAPTGADQTHLDELDPVTQSSTPDGGTITITIGVDRNYLKASVQDTGIGMSEEQHIFEEFYRTERAKEMSRHGTGLGLSIVRGIVQGCGGQLTLHSQVDQGSTFTFTLPLAETTTNGSEGQPC